MELQTFLQRKLSIVAIIGVSSFLGLLWLVGDGVVRYASLYNQTQVLGEKAAESFQCLPSTTFDKFFADSEKSITLYAPDKTVSFPLSALKKCFTATGCNQAGFSCSVGKVQLVVSCANEYFKKFPLGVEQYRVITGAGASAQVRIQDWEVNYDNLVEQLNTVIAKGISYCQVEGLQEAPRQNLGTIQLVVADETPGMMAGSFTERFIEIDASKSKLYYWNKGQYQTFSLTHGVRLPKEGIYLRDNVTLRQIIGSVDVSYIEKNTQSTDYVVVHK